MLSCAYCPKEFKYDSEKKRHQLSHFPGFQCTVCSKKFSFQSALRRHMKQHDRTERVQCQKCERFFSDSTLLKRHMDYAHKGNFECNTCKTVRNSEQALRIHMKTHKPASERKYQCGYAGCRKTFNFSHHLKHHELTHANKKQYHCDICQKGFIQLHHLKAHIKTHNPNNWLPCRQPNCKKEFGSKYARNRHFKYHHTVICTSCEELIEQEKYDSHVIKCNPGSAQDLTTKALENNLSSTNNHQNTAVKEVADPIPKLKVYRDCESFIGGCLTDGYSDENCLCAQISSPVLTENNNNIDFIQNENRSDSVTPSKINLDDKNDVCRSCDCATNRTKNVCKEREDDLPEIEYRIDGTIKIKEMFDIDIVSVRTEDKVKKNVSRNVKFVPFNSCKDVLGNCIVSGDGTIGEGCLCAKMMLDEQQLSAQEIEEITPYPTQ